MTLDLSPNRAAIRARLKWALARVGSSFNARANASAAPSKSAAWSKSYPRLCQACGLFGCASHSIRSIRAASRYSPSAPRHAAARAQTSPSRFPFRCRSGSRIARASFARPCLNSSWARCTPDDDEGAAAGAADPFFARTSPPRTREERVHLFPKVGGHLRVDVGEDRLGSGWRNPLGLLDGAANVIPDFLLEPCLVPVVPPPRALEVPPEPRERVTGLPRGDLRLIAVPRGVVARRMRPDSVRDRLDERGTESVLCPVHRLPCRAVDRQRVHAVHADAVEAVCVGLLRERRRSRLLRHRDGDRPLVVVAQEDGRRAEDAGEIHRDVEVRGARRAVPEECEDRLLVAEQL